MKAWSASLLPEPVARFAPGSTQAISRSRPKAVRRRALARLTRMNCPRYSAISFRVPKPVIAAVNGVAAGGGFVLAMMCDLRFAASDASFTTVFSKRGLIAEHGTAWLLPRIVGTSRALDLLWSSRRFDAAEAYRIGFVDRIEPREKLLDETKSYIRELAANISPNSLAVMKSEVYRHWSLAMEPAFRDADELMKAALKHR